MEYIIQRKEHKYDLCHQHCVSAHHFETYYMKNSISHRGSTVWNILEPSAVSARDYTKRAKKSHALRNLNFNEESPQMGCPQIYRDFASYWPYSTFYWLHSDLIILIFYFYFYFYYLINIFYTAPWAILALKPTMFK